MILRVEGKQEGLQGGAGEGQREQEGRGAVAWGMAVEAAWRGLLQEAEERQKTAGRECCKEKNPGHMLAGLS